MPVYAYACKDCGHAFDVRQSFSEDALSVCPECGGGLRKKFNTVGVVFKGSGFYRNDSRSGGKEAAGAESADSKPAPAAAEPASEPSSAEAAPAAAGAAAGASTAGGSKA
jgi:putative FmdB family regulatory protein